MLLVALIWLAVLATTEAVLPFCASTRSLPTCSAIPNTDIYRTYDGSCNNLRNPLYGSANTPLLRLMDPIYEDRRDAPIGFFDTLFYDGVKKPNAREVSYHIMSANFTLDNPRHTALLPHFGQFLAHDLTLSRMRAHNCMTNPDNVEDCFNVNLNDKDRSERQTPFFPVRRTDGCFAREGEREQLNRMSSFIDASHVYGASRAVVDRLRDFNSHGLMKVNEEYRGLSGQPYPPFDSSDFTECHRDSLTLRQLRG